jgi:hypothetical protein
LKVAQVVNLSERLRIDVINFDALFVSRYPTELTKELGTSQHFISH